ncbi:hypothetical protein [Lactiplantibacillus plantarum]|uniref:hypothetical protein n=1 Tax=Lactiplantibacillus plantarum TaxID=1590 RepID=UPI0028FC215B|nr:hypothetical protein [Lactiplantibacillus plantarum]WNW16307.1 hypothetical protein RUO99_02675 [Lactiplantibacillus plantarum]
MIEKITVYEKQRPIHQKLSTSSSAIRIPSRLEGVSDNAQYCKSVKSQSDPNTFHQYGKKA